MKFKTFTTSEAAREVGVSRTTVQNWIKLGLVRPPELQVRAGQPPGRLWTSRDVSRLRTLKGTIKTGRRKKEKQ